MGLLDHQEKGNTIGDLFVGTFYIPDISQNQWGGGEIGIKGSAVVGKAEMRKRGVLTSS